MQIIFLFALGSFGFILASLRIEYRLRRWRRGVVVRGAAGGAVGGDREWGRGVWGAYTDPETT